APAAEAPAAERAADAAESGGGAAEAPAAEAPAAEAPAAVSGAAAAETIASYVDTPTVPAETNEAEALARVLTQADDPNASTLQYMAPFTPPAKVGIGSAAQWADELESLIDSETDLERRLEKKAAFMVQKEQSQNAPIGLGTQFLEMFKNDKTWMRNPHTPSTAVGDGASELADDFDIDDDVTNDGMYYKHCRDNNFAVPTRGSSGNPQGGRWQRYLAANPAKKDEYAKLKGKLDLQADYRRKWCKEQYENYMKEKVHTRRQSKKEYSDARYYTAERCAEEDKNSTTAANYCLRCLAMGFPWVKYCTWRKALLFLYKTEGIQEEQMEAWTLT
ncbi:unnamed protein product, partial [Prorocentrum cordatum]